MRGLCQCCHQAERVSFYHVTPKSSRSCGDFRRVLCFDRLLADAQVDVAEILLVVALYRSLPFAELGPQNVARIKFTPLVFRTHPSGFARRTSPMLGEISRREAHTAYTGAPKFRSTVPMFVELESHELIDDWGTMSVLNLVTEKSLVKIVFAE